MEGGRIIIAVAAYNNGRYIGELLRSLTAQTYENIEVVVRDDGSSDDTVDIVREMSRHFPAIRLLETEGDIPGAKNNFFNLLLNIPLKDGEYLMFCDADDVWKQDKAERTLNAMRAAEALFPAETPMLVHTDLEVADEKLNTIAPSFFRYERLSPGRKALREMLVQNNVTGCTVMINSMLKNLVKENPKEAVMHDWWLTLIASAFGEIVVLDEATMLYRQHGGNQIGAYNAGNIASGIKKLSNLRRMKEIYLSMYRQAAGFMRVFGTLLDETDRKIVSQYAEMEYLPKLKRISRIIKGRYYKNTLLRNIGQFIVV